MRQFRVRAIALVRVLNVYEKDMRWGLGPGEIA